MSSFARQIVDSESWIFVNVVGRSRQVFAIEHCFIKKVFIIMTNLFSCHDSGIQGIFLLFRNVFNKDQYNFGLVLGSNTFSDKGV